MRSSVALQIDRDALRYIALLHCLNNVRVFGSAVHIRDDSDATPIWICGSLHAGNHVVRYWRHSLRIKGTAGRGGGCVNPPSAAR